jgi:hypothetical protein
MWTCRASRASDKHSRFFDPGAGVTAETVGRLNERSALSRLIGVLTGSRPMAQ